LPARLVQPAGRKTDRRLRASAAAGVVMAAPIDLLLAHGYFLALDEAEQRVMRPHPPLGLLYLSSHLKARGVRVGIFDATFRTLADFAHLLDRARPPVVGIAVNLMTKRNALRMIAMARQSGARVVIGGPDPPVRTSW
jgi:anaerobic magnesium-protoporphyrin IX monomethyl ester cyclase